MAGQATLLQVLWTFWLLAGLSLLPRPLPFFLVPAFFVSMACSPWQADHVTWRAFLMMWLAVHIVFAAAAIRASRSQAPVLGASAVGLLWIGFQGGGSYGWYAAHGLLAVLAAALLILIGTGMMLLFSEHRIVIRQQAEENQTLASTDQPTPGDAEPAIVPGFDSAAPPEPAQPEPAQPEPTEPDPVEVFAERLTVYVLRTPAEPVRFMVGRDVTRLPGKVLDNLGGGPAVADHAEDTGFKERLTDAAAGYLAEHAGDPASAAATRFWVTRDAYPEVAVADACDRLADALKSMLAAPIGKAAAEIRLPAVATPALAGIAADFILEPVTRPLAQAAQAWEIIGVAVGIGTGLHPLAFSCAKMLAHSAFDQALEKAVTTAFDDLAAKPLEPPKPGEDIADWGFDLFRDEPDDIEHPGMRGPGSWF
jgi:hypothetical protein